MRNINLCLHDVVQSNSDIVSNYDLTTDQIKTIIETATDAVEAKIADGFTLYFDDSYGSLIDRVLPIERPAFGGITSAVVTDTIDTPGHLSNKDIVDCLNEGVAISSHGVSHAALAVFNETGTIINTPSAGNYQNMPYGKSGVLTSHEVFFQLNESQRRLEDICQIPITEFVLPFGLYSQRTLAMIGRLTTYKFVASCHSAIDVGQFLRPRHLVTQANVGNISIDLFSLKDDYAMLD